MAYHFLISAGLVHKVMENCGSLFSSAKYSLQNPGVTVDQSLTPCQHVKHLISTRFIQQRNIEKLRSIVYELGIIIHAVISSHLNYPNSLFVCLIDKFLL